MSNMNADILYYVAPNPVTSATTSESQWLFSQPDSWFDLTKGHPSTVAPARDNTVLFPTGYHLVPGFDGTAGKAVLQNGAKVDFIFNGGVPVASEYSFRTLVLQSSSKLAVGGLASNEVVIGKGATLNLNGASEGPDPTFSNIGTLINHGGTLSLGQYPGVTLGEVAISRGSLALHEHPEFIQISSPYTTPSTLGGISSGESVIPITNGLIIDLGNVAKGTHLDPLNIASFDPSTNGTTFTVHIANIVGSGFTPDLLPLSPTPTGEQQIASFAVDTMTKGTHTMTVAMTDTYTTAAGAHGVGLMQTLVLTDHIV
jgi:hypothetical protein